MLVLTFVLTVPAVAFLFSAVIAPSIATRLIVGSMAIRIAGLFKRGKRTPALVVKEEV
ncbi:hypothetical protein PQR71_14045 [Paraburkholderia fungorum]|uniref:hypothetical protein n=1 Tax=Paraburkholderia fungorum TaxID=134537 RepID=UPI0038B8D0B9